MIALISKLNTQLSLFSAVLALFVHRVRNAYLMNKARVSGFNSLLAGAAY